MKSIKEFFRKYNPKFFPAVIFSTPIFLVILLLIKIILVLNILMTTIVWFLPTRFSEVNGKTKNLWLYFWNKSLDILSTELERSQIQIK